jgi:hypothetical protein
MRWSPAVLVLRLLLYHDRVQQIQTVMHTIQYASAKQTFFSGTTLYMHVFDCIRAYIMLFRLNIAGKIFGLERGYKRF